LYVEESEEELCFVCFDELEKLLNFLVSDSPICDGACEYRIP